MLTQWCTWFLVLFGYCTCDKHFLSFPSSCSCLVIYPLNKKHYVFYSFPQVAVVISWYRALMSCCRCFGDAVSGMGSKKRAASAWILIPIKNIPIKHVNDLMRCFLGIFFSLTCWLGQSAFAANFVAGSHETCIQLIWLMVSWDIYKASFICWH